MGDAYGVINKTRERHARYQMTSKKTNRKRSIRLTAHGGATGMPALAVSSIQRNRYSFVSSAAPFSDWCRLIEIEGIVQKGPIWECWWNVPGWYCGLSFEW